MRGGFSNNQKYLFSKYGATRKRKKAVGRPRTSQMKSYHYKADGDLVPYLELYSKDNEKWGESRNGFINTAVREKLVRDGVLKQE